MWGRVFFIVIHYYYLALKVRPDGGLRVRKGMGASWGVKPKYGLPINVKRAARSRQPRLSGFDTHRVVVGAPSASLQTLETGVHRTYYYPAPDQSRWAFAGPTFLRSDPRMVGSQSRAN